MSSPCALVPSSLGSLQAPISLVMGRMPHMDILVCTVFWIPLKEGMIIWTEPLIIKLKQWQKTPGSVDS